MLVDDERGQKLKDALGRAGDLNDAESGGQPVELYREDLLRGYHVDIKDYSVSGSWQSLCRRDGAIDLLNTLDEITVSDNEGMVRLGATQAADGSNPDVLKLYEGLFAWTGWSLTAPAPGNTISTEQDKKGGDTVGRAINTAPDGLPFEANFTVHPKSLPSLRYGRRYSMRVRTVDLAHNALPWDAKCDPKTVPSPPDNYRRYEPVEPPSLALIRGPKGLEGPADGEAMARLAISTFNETPADNTAPTKAVARRHVVPPRTSVKQAETHGKIDKNDRLDPTSYALLASRDAPLHQVMLSMAGVKTPYSAEDEALALPYLPDPFADQVAARFIGPASVGVTSLPPIAYYPTATDTWPDALPFKILIVEKAGASPIFRKATRTLEVPLAKADMVTLRFSHILPKDGLEQMGVWQWFLDRHGSEVAAVNAAMDRSKRGLNWLLTPWLDVELVHAVQKPLVKPAFAELSIGRNLRETHATPLVITPVDSRSTNKLDLFGRWNEPDDRHDAPQTLYRRSHAV
jgi:hypothetical protein